MKTLSLSDAEASFLKEFLGAFMMGDPYRSPRGLGDAIYAKLYELGIEDLGLRAKMDSGGVYLLDCKPGDDFYDLLHDNKPKTKTKKRSSIKKTDEPKVTRRIILRKETINGI